MSDHLAKTSKLRKAAGLPEKDPRHGTPNGYKYWMCRCRKCTASVVKYNRKLRTNKRLWA